MILAAKKNGARLIVVDPRRIPEVEKADLFLQIRPGTDVALMLGWLRVIIGEGLYDRDFVAKWTVGFEDLKAAVAEYTPERVAAITWLTPEQVVQSARLYATTKPAMITWGFGLDKQGVNATQAARARTILRRLAETWMSRVGSLWVGQTRSARSSAMTGWSSMRRFPRSSGPSNWALMNIPFSVSRAGRKRGGQPPSSPRLHASAPCRHDKRGPRPGRL